MEKYSLYTKCSKCGSKVITTKYCRNTNFDCCWVRLNMRPDAGEEHLDIRCGNCNYTWPERPLDK